MQQPSREELRAFLRERMAQTHPLEMLVLCYRGGLPPCMPTGPHCVRELGRMAAAIFSGPTADERGLYRGLC